MQDEPTRSDFQLGDWLVQPALCRLSKDGRTVQVRAKVMDLLTYLADHPGQVISKDRLLDDVWGSLAVSESALTRTVTELRQAIEDDADHPHLLETIAKRGYRLIGTVTRAPRSPVAALELEAPPQEGSPALAGTSAVTGVPTAGPRQDASHSARNAWHSTWLMLAGATLGVAVLVALSAWTPVRVRPSMAARPPGEVNAHLSRVSLAVPESVSSVGGVRLSPDGRRVLFTGVTRDGTTTFLRDLSQPEARRAERCFDQSRRFAPLWSPDGREVLLTTSEAVLTCDVETGVIRQVVQTTSHPLSSWSSNGAILLDSGPSGGPLFVIDARGGALRQETRVDTEGGEIGHAFPKFLPDGKHYLFVVYHRDTDVAGLYLGLLGSLQRTRLSSVTTPAVPAADHVVWVRRDALMAQPLDVAQARLTGQPVAVLQGYELMVNERHLPFGVTQEGDFAFPVNPVRLRRFGWRDRTGRRLAEIGEAGVYGGFSLSSDASQLVVSRRSARVDDWGLWRIDLRRSLTSPWTLAAARLHDPRWHPDGTRVAASSMHSSAGQQRQFIVLVDQSGRLERILDSGVEQAAAPDDWTPDGRSLVYHVDGKAELRLLSIGTGASSVLAHADDSIAPARAVVSPDGRFIAYQQATGGRADVWVDTFPKPSARVQVSRAGGLQPRWRKDAGELYFLASDGSLEAVSMAPGPVPRPGVPTTLFATGLRPDSVLQQYAPAPDGSRFLMLEPIPTAERPRIDLVLNGANLFRQ